MASSDRGPTLLLDAASLYYRSYFALPSSMAAPDGRPHQAVRGFLSTIDALVRRTGASGLVVCWDADWRPQWRVDLLPSYKTHRLAEPEGGDSARGESGGKSGGEPGSEAEPDDLGPQVDALAAILDLAGIALVGARDHEADDVIASLATSLPGPTTVVTGDRDLMQVVTESTSLLLTVNGGMEKWPLLDPAGVRERYGVEPSQYVDMAVLRGDPSDGIPGVPGIGAKTAPALIAHFGSLRLLLEAAHAPAPARPLTPRIAGALLEHEAQVLAAQTVATAVTGLELTVTPTIPTSPADPGALDALLDAWGVRRFLPAFVSSTSGRSATSGS